MSTPARPVRADPDRQDDGLVERRLVVPLAPEKARAQRTAAGEPPVGQRAGQAGDDQVLSPVVATSRKDAAQKSSWPTVAGASGSPGSTPCAATSRASPWPSSR